MTDTRCPYGDDVAPFVIGALDADALDAFVGHLAACASCRTEVEQLRSMALMLPLATEPVEPPPELKQRVMAVVRSEAQLLRASGAGADVVAPPPRRRWWAPRPLTAALGGLAAAAAAAIVVVALAGGGADTRVVEAEVAMARASAHVELADGSGTLVASGMPSPARGHVYAIWTRRAGERARYVGTLGAPPSNGSTRARLSLDGVREVMVTVEPVRVGRDPTTKPVVTARLA